MRESQGTPNTHAGEPCRITLVPVSLLLAEPPSISDSCATTTTFSTPEWDAPFERRHSLSTRERERERVSEREERERERRRDASRSLARVGAAWAVAAKGPVARESTWCRSCAVQSKGLSHRVESNSRTIARSIDRSIDATRDGETSPYTREKSRERKSNAESSVLGRRASLRPALHGFADELAGAEAFELFQETGPEPHRDVSARLSREELFLKVVDGRCFSFFFPAEKHNSGGHATPAERQAVSLF